MGDLFPRASSRKSLERRLKHFRALLERPLPEGVPRQLTRTQIAMIDEGLEGAGPRPGAAKRKRAKKEPVKEGPAKGPSRIWSCRLRRSGAVLACLLMVAEPWTRPGPWTLGRTWATRFVRDSRGTCACN